VSAGAITRTGELTHRSLLDAIASERAAGRRPDHLAVADEQLERAAMEILAASAHGQDALRSVLPRVVVDPDLLAGAWELRT